MSPSIRELKAPFTVPLIIHLPQDPNREYCSPGVQAFKLEALWGLGRFRAEQEGCRLCFECGFEADHGSEDSIQIHSLPLTL